MVNGHNSARLRSRVVLPTPDCPVTTKVSPTSRRRSSGLTSCLPSGVRTSTSSSWTVPSTHGVVVIVGSALALLVGDDQAVQTDDGRPVAGEQVVGVAEEGQPALDAAECRRGLASSRRA